MRKLLVAVTAAAALAAVPSAARAGWTMEGSLGLGWQLSPGQRAPINVMVAPGYGLLDNVLKLELGLAANLGDVENSKFDLELRPMLVVQPPLFPVYGRAILAVQNFINGPTTVAVGAAGGMSFGLAGVALFVELGLLPRSINGDFRWFVEGRAGVSFPL